MKLSKRLLSIVLALCVLATIIGIMPVTALADTENEPVIRQESGDSLNEEVTEEPTDDPEVTNAPSEIGTEAPTEEPVEVASEEPAEATEAPAEAVSEEPAEATEAPAEAVSEEPAETTEAPTEEPVNEAFTAVISDDSVRLEDFFTVSGQTIGATDTVTIRVFGLEYTTVAENGEYTYDIQVPGTESMEGVYTVEVTDGVNTEEFDLYVTGERSEMRTMSGSVSISYLAAIKHRDERRAMAFITEVVVPQNINTTISMTAGSTTICYFDGIDGVTVRCAALIGNMPNTAAAHSTPITVNVSAEVSGVVTASETLQRSWDTATDISADPGDNGGSIISGTDLDEVSAINLQTWLEAWSN